MDENQEIQEEEEVVEETQEDEVTDDESGEEEENALVEEDPEETERLETEKKPWFRKKFDKLTWEREQAKREKEDAEQRAAELQKKLEELSQAPKASDRPKLVDFDTDEDYFDALTEWKLDQREAKSKAERDRVQAETAAQQKEMTFREKVMKINTAGSEKYKDYEDVVFSLPGDVMSTDMAQALFETDSPEEIAYLLGKNPKEAARIAKLSPLKKAVELGKIESRLKSKKTTTNAPAPIKPVKGTADTGFDPDEILAKDPAKWIQLRNEGKI